MSIKLNQEIWVHAERLYITCYSAEEFKIMLKKFGMEYDNEIYKDFQGTSKALYTFMSNPNYDFANFMQTIPTYKYLPMLREIVFDEKIIATRRDNWNYYSNYIKDWHPAVIKILKNAGVDIDNESKKLKHKEEDLDFETPDFLPYDFNDLFLDYIRKEINESYNNGQLLSVVVLSRKLLEAITIRVMEIVFSKSTTIGYSASNHKLWYDKEKGRHLFFSELIFNLKNNSKKFDEDKDLIKESCDNMENIRKKANTFVHSDYKIPDEDFLKTLSIEMTVGKIRKIYRKYCNP